MAVGALFVIALRGAALSGTEQLHIAQQRTEAVAAALAATPMDDANILAAQAQSDAGRVR